jgi:hypothetical protein
MRFPALSRWMASIKLNEKICKESYRNSSLFFYLGLNPKEKNGTLHNQYSIIFTPLNNRFYTPLL